MKYTLLIFALLASCATTGGISCIGKDTYKLDTLLIDNMNWADVTANSIRSATAFCEEKGMHMEMMREIKTSSAHRRTSEVIFKCTPKDAPVLPASKSSMPVLILQ